MSWRSIEGALCLAIDEQTEMCINMKALSPSIETNRAEWYFVWDWWPVPQFLFALLGADGCRAFVDALSERSGDNRLLVSFALAVEHRRAPIISENDLEDTLVRICAPDYEFGSAKSLASELDNARWTDIGKKDKSALDRTPLTSDSPEALKRAILAKALPSGRVENLALMRATLAARTKG